MANSCPQRAGPGPGPKGRARAQGRGWGGGWWGGRGPPWALARPSVDMNWPWSDLLTDVVLTNVGGLGVKGRGEGVVGEPLCPSVVASGGSKSSKNEGLGFLKHL